MTIDIERLVVYRNRRFLYRYEFIKKGRRIKFRGFSVDVKDRLSECDRPNIYNRVLFAYPDYVNNYLNYNNCLLKSGSVPTDIRWILTHNDVVISNEVKEAAENLSGLKMDKEYCKS
jgi:hypothetical protein